MRTEGKPILLPVTVSEMLLRKTLTGAQDDLDLVLPMAWDERIHSPRVSLF